MFVAWAGFEIPPTTLYGDIERYNEHTYLELKEFDTALTALDIPKTASDEWSEYCEYDKEYVDRFLRIVHNTN
ncbi:MAG: hypothetical protein UHT63_02945 [Acutalibacteraceae bacterium]|nr:hypothetical protein [Acutalibacteraceae bacterium]